MEELQVTSTSGYMVQLDNFEGPLDLLLYLIQQNEMDIFTLSLSKIAEDYMRFIAEIPSVDLDQAGEFLVLASTLILFKVRQLLPTPPVEEEEEIFDPEADKKRWAEFEHYRKVAQILKEYEIKWSSVHRRAGVAEKGEVVWEFDDVSIFDLYQAFQKVLNELGSERPSVVFGEDYTVDEKMAELRMLLMEMDTFSLTVYLQHTRSRAEIIVTFLALLELIRLQDLVVRQSKVYGEIWIVRCDKTDEPAKEQEEEETED